MARSQANLHFDVFEGLQGLSRDAKLLYLALLVEPTVNQAGVGALRERRWAKEVEMSTGETQRAMAELDQKLFALFDQDTEEMLVRTIIRRDGVAEKPNLLWAACRAAVQVKSRRIRRVLAAELRKLPPRPAPKPSKDGRLYEYPDPHATADILDPPGGPDGARREDIRNSSASGPELSRSDTSRTVQEVSANGSPPAQSVPAASQYVLPGNYSGTIAEPPVRGREGGGGGGVVKSPSSVSSVSRSAQKRGSRLPEDFAETDAMARWAHDRVPLIDIARETEKFINYFSSAPGAKGLKLDWVKTWKNWMLNADERLPRHLRAVPSVPSRLPADPVLAFAELRERGDAQQVADLIGAVWFEPSQRPSDTTPFAEWIHTQRVAFIDAHETELRVALAKQERDAG